MGSNSFYKKNMSGKKTLSFECTPLRGGCKPESPKSARIAATFRLSARAAGKKALPFP
jgi:hypothetical protein